MPKTLKPRVENISGIGVLIYLRDTYPNFIPYAEFARIEVDIGFLKIHVKHCEKFLIEVDDAVWLTEKFEWLLAHYLDWLERQG